MNRITLSAGFIIGGLVTLGIIQLATGSFINFYRIHTTADLILTFVGGIIGYVLIGRLSD